MTIIQREAIPVAGGTRPTPRPPDASGFAAAMAEATATAPPGARARVTEHPRSGGQPRHERPPHSAPRNHALDAAEPAACAAADRAALVTARGPLRAAAPTAAAAGASAESAPMPTTDSTPDRSTDSVAEPTPVPTTDLATEAVLAPGADPTTVRAAESAPSSAWAAGPTAGPALTATVDSDDSDGTGTGTGTGTSTDTAASPTGDAAAAAAAHVPSDGRAATAPPAALALPEPQIFGGPLATPVEAAAAGELAAADTALTAAPVTRSNGTTAAGTPAPIASAPAGTAGATSIPAGAGPLEAQAGESAPVAAGSSAAAPSPVTPPGAPAVAAVPTVQLASPVASPAAQPAPAPLAAQVSAPLFTLAAAGRGEHVLTISVTPDSLGPVTVRAHVTGEGVRVELFAPTDLGRDALRAILPELRRDLAGAGLGGTLDLSQQNEPAAERDRQRPREPDIGDAPPVSADAVPAPPGWGAPSTIDVFA